MTLVVLISSGRGDVRFLPHDRVVAFAGTSPSAPCRRRSRARRRACAIAVTHRARREGRTIRAHPAERGARDGRPSGRRRPTARRGCGRLRRMRLLSLLGIILPLVVTAAPRAQAAPLAGHDFITEARELLVLGACADGPPPAVKPAVHAAHCKTMRAAQDAYK